MACDVVRMRQLIEVAKKEYRRLADLKSQGYEQDLDSGILDIDEAMREMHAIAQKRPDKLLERESVDSMFINELNNNRPKDGKKPITVISGTKVGDRIEYQVTYGKGTKEYTLPAARITADQMSASNYAPMAQKLVQGNAPINTTPQVEAQESVDKYSKAFTEFANQVTGAEINNETDLLRMNGLLTESATIESAAYYADTHTITRVPKGANSIIEKRIRDEVYTNYMRDNAIEPEDFSQEVVKAAEKGTKIDIKATTQKIVDWLDSKDKVHELNHELVHAGALKFMTDPKNKNDIRVKRVEDLYKVALANKDRIQKQMVEDGQVNNYWASNIHEFVAEGLSNPKLINMLSQIRYKKDNKLSTVMKELVNALLKMLKLDKKVENNVHEYLLDAYASIAEKQNTSIGMVKGSDAAVRIGESNADVKEEEFDVDLGDELTSLYVSMLQMDMDSGLIPEDRQGLHTFYTDQERFNAEKPTITEFDALQSDMLATYQETMNTLDTGNVTLESFQNAVENTAGEINLKTQKLKVRWNKMSRLSKLSEVFLHEVNHKVSSHVFAKNIQLKRLMEDLRKAAMDNELDYKLFLEGIDNPTDSEIETAKMKFEYTFDETANIEEFYAYATTNENVYNAIKDVTLKTPLIKQLKLDPKKRHPIKVVVNQLIDAINTVWRQMSGRGVTGGQMIADMVVQVAELDAEMHQMAKKEAAQEDISDYVAGKMNELDEKVKPVVEQTAQWVDKLQSIHPSKLGKHLEKIPVLNELMATGIAQYLWRTVTQDTTKEGAAEMYMVFRHSKQVVEKHTTDIRNGVKSVATEMYKDIDEDTKEVVNRVMLERDMTQFELDELENLLKSKKNIEIEIENTLKEVEKTIDDKLNAETMAQIEGLAEYLVKGTTSRLDQQMNANNIAYGIHLDTKKKSLIAPVEMIDKLVSLKALQMTSIRDKKLLREMIQTENGKDILDKTTTMYRKYISNMRLDATIDYYDPIPKGYTKPADGLLRYELVPENEVKAQESVLMNLAEADPYTVINGVKYYLMTGRTKSVGFTEGAIGLISHTTEGIPVSSVLRRENDMKGDKRVNDRKLKEKTANLIKSIKEGKNTQSQFKMVKGQTLVPVYNHNKELVDYRIQLNKQEKEVHLPDRETQLEDVLSNTFSRSIKTSLTATENKRVVDTIIENGAQGVRENPDDYVLVEEYTEEDRMNGVKRERRHDRWEYLPDHTKNYIFQKTRNKGILIHKDFVELMTGEKDMTIGNFAAFGFDMKNSPIARARLMALESYIGEVLGYVKQAMIVLNGDILVGNQVSNAMVAASHGINPIKYTKKFKERWKQLNDYNEKVQMLSELEIKQMAGEDVGRKIKQLEKQLEGNVWDELVKDGQYTALVEDINVDAKMDGQLATMVQNQIDKSDFKGLVESVRNVLYIDKTSALYNTMLKSVHYGDAITRQIIKEELEEKMHDRWIAKYSLDKAVMPEDKERVVQDYIANSEELTREYNAEKQKILNYLDQLLVNYGYIPNRWWSYSDKQLGQFFMKYYLNQPKALMSMVKKNPTKMALLQGTQVATGVDIADPVDTYTNSGLDGVMYRQMLDDAPGLIVEPNLLDVIPSVSAALVMR